jgi:hypothetical protein
MRGATCAIFMMTFTPPQIINACIATKFRSLG